MFGNKKYKKAKEKKFANENERKRFFAIQANYKKKKQSSSLFKSRKKK